MDVCGSTVWTAAVIGRLRPQSPSATVSFPDEGSLEKESGPETDPLWRVCQRGLLGTYDLVGGGETSIQVAATEEAQLKWKIILSCEIVPAFAYGPTGGSRKIGERENPDSPAPHEASFIICLYTSLSRINYKTITQSLPSSKVKDNIDRLVGRPPTPTPGRPRRRTLRASLPLPRLGVRQRVPAIPAVPAPVELRRTRGAAPGPFPAARPTDLHLPAGAHPLAEMTSLPTTPSPGEELMATPVLQATETLSPEAEASTALIAVVITVVFLTLLSVVILIFFYLYKNKGSYVTYEPAEGEPGAVLQMESDSAKGREKEEYFI
ncbi:small cell adhesion glycoprotein [Camelus dromedarius]